MAMKKIQIAIPPAVAEEMDAYCKQKGFSRSNMITMSIVSYLTAHRATDTLSALLDVFNDMKSNGVTPENEEELGKIQNILAVLTARTE